MFEIETGVISTTRKVKIPVYYVSINNNSRSDFNFVQLVAVAKDAERVRMARGAYSAGTVRNISMALKNIRRRRKNLQSQGMARRPTAKKKLNINSITVATKPEEWVPSQTVPAKIAMQHPCPMTANIMSLRRPRLYYFSIYSRASK